jgi:putative SOS response-associated peptidase YedK
MRIHYQSPEVHELAQFKPVPHDFLLRYAHDIWPGYPAPVWINDLSHSWVIGSFGLIPPWADPHFSKSTFTAPVENITALLTFRNVWALRQLCIIPVSCFFVPDYASGKSVSWKIERNDHRPFGVAGLWEVRVYDQSITHWSFAILTRNAENDPLMGRFFHRDEEKRTPLALAANEYEKWLWAPSESAMLELLHPLDSAVFCAQESDMFQSV